ALDTAARVSATPPLSWGDGPKPRTNPMFPGPTVTVNDPWGSPRSGTAFVNAMALSKPGPCDYAPLPFPCTVINPKPGPDNPQGDALSGLDTCGLTRPMPEDTLVGGLLGPDYQLAQQRLLHSEVGGQVTDDVVSVYRNLPYDDTTHKRQLENDGRLTDFLRAPASANILIDP